MCVRATARVPLANLYMVNLSHCISEVSSKTMAISIESG